MEKLIAVRANLVYEGDIEHCERKEAEVYSVYVREDGIDAWILDGECNPDDCETEKEKVDQRREDAIARAATLSHWAGVPYVVEE